MESVKTTAIVLFLIGCASAFGWMITYLQIPCGGDEVFSRTHFEQISYFIDRKYSSAFFGNGHGRAPLIVIVTLVLLPVVKAAGMSEITFGILLMLNLGIGLTSPPVGASLFVGCMVGKTTIEKTSRAMLPLWPAMLIVLFLVTYLPWFTEFLPNIFMK
jgi:TRAP-type C4-dicarboxylate transport system permease large subunit